MVLHSMIYFIGKILPAIISIVSLMIYTRLVSPEIYGTFSLVITIAGLINILFFQWIRSSLIRFYNDKNSYKNFYGTIIISQICVYIFVSAIFILLYYIYKPTFLDRKMLIAYLIIVLFLSVFELMSVYFRTILKPRLVVSVNILRNLITLLFSVFFIVLGIDFYGLVVGIIFGFMFGIIIFSRKLNSNKLKAYNLNSDKESLKKFLIYGLPITFSFALSVAMQNIDKIMISIILGVKENGSYAVSYDISYNTIFMILMSISLAGFPLVLKTLKEKGMLEAENKFKEYIEILLVVSLPVTIGFLIIAEDFLNLLIGDSYIISYHLIFFIVLASYLQGIKSFWFDQILQISGKTKAFFIPTLVALLLNIILNYILLNRLGVEGAAFSTFVSFFIATLISYRYSRKVFVVKLNNKDCLNLLICVLLMSFSIFLIQLENIIFNLTLKIILGILIYSIFIIVFNVFNIKTKLINYKIRKGQSKGDKI